MNVHKIILLSRFLILFLAGLVVIFTGCKKEFPRRAAITTEAINKQTAIATGNILDLGQNAVLDHGFCWDIAGFPSVDGNNLLLGGTTHTGEFSGKIQGLLPKQVYYLKAFMRSEEGVNYGSLISFTTPDLPGVLTDSVQEITDITAKSRGTVTSDGGAPILERGICWADMPQPDTTKSVYKDSVAATGSYSYQISGLTGGKQYYIRAWATNIYGIQYANEITFTSAQPVTIPIVTTSDATNITINSADAGGEVVSDGGSTVEARGVCWNTNPYPTIIDSKTVSGSGPGIFNCTMSSLNANTTYYFRAFAFSTKGIGYGENKSFTTSPQPTFATLNTKAITDITSTMAMSGGDILADGGSPVTVRGVCWSTNPNPSISDYVTTDGEGTGSFTSSLTGLNPGTKYYVRAYATNGFGTAYGNEVNFSAGQNITAPTVTTTAITNILQNSAQCSGNVIADGGAAVSVRGVCWSIFNTPTISNSHTSDGSGLGTYSSNITGLLSSTAYYARAYATNSAGTAYGNILEFSTLPEPTIPSVTTAPVTNITNNSAISGGTVSTDGGATITERGACWNTTGSPTIINSHTSDGTGTGSFISQISGLQSNTFYYTRAYAKNSIGTAYGAQQTFTTNPDPVIPTVTTASATNLTQTTATTGGNVLSDGGLPVTERGVCYSINPNPTTTDNKTLDGSGLGTFTSNLTGLIPGTMYYVRAYAVNGVGTSYGNEITLTTLNAGCQGITSISYEGKTYNTVEIGFQCWFKENLNVGIAIVGSQIQSNNGIIEKYCYNNTESNCSIYGGLYLWEEVMQYSTIGTQGICPSGWHIPTNQEIIDLRDFLGGTTIAGGKMKEIGTANWAPPNSGATNESFFSGLPGGGREPLTGVFSRITTDGSFWSSLSSGTTACKFQLNHDNANFDYYCLDKNSGFSARCIKN